MLQLSEHACTKMFVCWSLTFRNLGSWDSWNVEMLSLCPFFEISKPRNQETKKLWIQEAKKSRNFETKKPRIFKSRNFETKEPWNQENEKPRTQEHKNTRTQEHERGARRQVMKLLSDANRNAFKSNQLTINPKLSFFEVFDYFW